MKNLNPLDTDMIDAFDEIHTSKRNPTKNILNSIKPSIVSRYEEYKNLFDSNCLEKLKPQNYASEKENALLNCYTVKIKALELLIKNIKDNQDNAIRSVCQFCGINTDSTIDHYLPKEHYPEFSVAHLNLIPCCPDCNSKKSVKWLNSDKERIILNLYKDIIPNIKFLFIDLEFNGDIPVGKYYLSNQNNIDNDLYKLIESHYKELDLLNRYNDRFNSNYTEIFNSLNNSTFKGKPNLVQTFLISDYNENVPSFGINHYRLVLKEALANNDNFKRIITE